MKVPAIERLSCASFAQHSMLRPNVKYVVHANDELKNMPKNDIEEKKQTVGRQP